MSEPVIRATDADQIAWEAFRELQVAIISAMGDQATPSMSGGAGTAYVRRGSRFVNAGTVAGANVEWNLVGQWAFPHTTSDAPDVTLDAGKADAEVIVTDEAKLFGLVKVSVFSEALRSGLEGAARFILTKLLEQAGEKIASQKFGGYIRAALANRIPNLAQNVAWSAMAKIEGVALANRRRRVGIQIISTRSQRPYGWSVFSGKPCYRFRRGRPALPASVWLSRYNARLKRRNKTGRHRKATGVTLPPTMGPRPARAITGAKRGKITGNFGASPPKASDLRAAMGEWDLARTLGEAFARKFAELPGATSG